jgi:uncharacterized membrane protein YphA (DoxX/SURF4 family)
MNLIQRLQNYGDTHHSKWLDILRIALGLILFIKGFYYVRNTEELDQLLKNNDMHLYNYVVIHYVAFAHLVGGILIMLGLVTKIAILIQLPVLIGAIIFINAKAGLITPNPEFYLSILVLFMLVFFFIYGSGEWSMDAYLEKHKSKWDGPDL